MQRVGVAVGRGFVERLVPDRQRVEIAVDPLAQLGGREDLAVSPCGQAEALHGLRIELQDDLVRRTDPAHRDRMVQIIAVGVFEEAHFGRQRLLPEAAGLDVAFQLFRIGLAGAFHGAVDAPPAGEAADTGDPLMVDQIVGVATGIARRPVVPNQPGKAEPGADVDQHVLEGSNVPVGLHHRVADRIGRAVGARDRPVEQRDTVPALEIGGVRQHQVGIGDHLGGVGIGADDVRNAIAAGVVPIGQHVHGLSGVHRRVPAHVRHVDEQRVDRIGVAAPGIGGNHVQHPVGSERRLPRECLVDPDRTAVLVHQQVSGPGREAQGRSRHRRAGRDLAGFPCGLERRRRRLGKRRLVAEAARYVDRPQ